MNVRVIPANQFETHIPALARILCECVADGAAVHFLNDLDQAGAEEFWRSVGERYSAGELLVLGAFVDEALAGTVSLILNTPPNQPHRAEISKLLVSTRFRRMGIAKALMQAVEAEAKIYKRDLLILDTNTESAAELLYLSLGWQKIGEIPRYSLTPDGRPKPASFFYKDLSPKN